MGNLTKGIREREREFMRVTGLEAIDMLGSKAHMHQKVLAQTRNTQDILRQNHSQHDIQLVSCRRRLILRNICVGPINCVYIVYYIYRNMMEYVGPM